MYSSEEIFAQFAREMQGSSEEKQPSGTVTSDEIFSQFAKEMESTPREKDLSDLISEENKARKEDKERLDNILTNLDVQIGPWKTGLKYGDVLGEEGASVMIGMGHMLMDSYRGLKQIAGIDVEEEIANERAVDALYTHYPKSTLSGAVVGAVFDPVGAAVGGVAGKAVQVSKVLNKASTVGKYAGYGAIVGGVQAGTGFEDPEGLSREAMTVLGLTLGGGLGYIGGKFADKGMQKAAYEDVHRLERLVGERTKDGRMTLDDALAEIEEVYPDVIEASKKASDEYGIKPDLYGAGRNYDMFEEAEKGTKPLDTIRGNRTVIGNAIDKGFGVISSQIKDLNPRVFGKLRQFDSATSYRPEKYATMREDFAQLFPTSSGRKIKNPALVLSNSEINTLNKYLVNGKFDDARNLLLEARGEWAVEAFDKALKVYDELSEELLEYGIIKEKLPNYWHRSISASKRSDMLEALKAKSKKDSPEITLKFGSDIEGAWNKHLRNLNKKANEKYGRDLNELEENNAFQSWLFKDQSDLSTIGLAKKRKIQDVGDDLIPFYNNPLEALDSYIHRSIREIEMAKFFGKDNYTAGLKNSKDVDGLFNLDSAIEGFAGSDMFKGLDDLDAEQLRNLLKIRFGKGNSSIGELTANYKALVNITLLANPVSAATQFGDLGVAMYKNGVKRVAKALLNRADFSGKRITLEDMGLEQRFQEFEDIASVKNASDATKRIREVQDTLFRLSGFNWVDRIGKETLLNSALDKAVDIVKSKGKKYDSWAKEMRGYLGSDFAKLDADLRKYAANPTKENITDDIKSYVFSALADIQPISRSEVPVYYLTSDVGKTVYTLKTFLLKQMDIMRNDVINPLRKGDAITAGANLAKYVSILGMTNLGAQTVKDLIVGDVSVFDLPEEVQALTAADIAFNIAKAGAAPLGINEFSMKAVADEGLKGYAATWIPPVPIADEFLKVANRIISDPENADEAITESTYKRLIQYVPLVGRPLADRIIQKDQESSYSAGGYDYSTPGYAEGGLVEAMTESPVTEAAKPSQAIPEPIPVPAVDEAAPQESVEEMQARMTEPSPEKEGMVHEPAAPMGEKATKTFEFVEDVIQAAPQAWESLGLMEKLALVSAPVPIVGDLLGLGSDISTYISDEDSNTWTNYGLTALGVLPFIPNMSLGIKIVDKNKRTRSVDKIIKEGKSPFEGKEFDYWRGVEKDTIELAQERPREVGEHATTHVSLAKRFAEEQAYRGKIGTVYHRKATLNKGIVIEDTDIHNAPKTVEKLLQHKDFQDEESQKLLRMIGMKYNQRMRIINDLPDSLLDRIDSEKTRLDEVYGRFVRDFLTNRGYDHIAYVNVAEKLKTGNYDVSLAFLKPDDWNKTAMEIRPVQGYAEGGVVEQPSSTPIEEKPKMEKLDPGLYQDDTGKLFHIDSEGKVKDMKDIVSAFKN